MEVTVERLLWTVENFFEYQGTSFHELGLYFLIALPRESGLYEKEHFEGVEDYYPPAGRNLKLYFKWHSLDALDNLTIVPEFLRAGLRSVPDHPQHVVERRRP